MRQLQKLIAAALILCTALSYFTSCGAPTEENPGGDHGGAGDSYSELHETVTVGIADGENYTVTSENPVRVQYGNDATVKITFNEGFEFDCASVDAEYSNGTLTLKNIQFPTTVEIFTKKSSGSGEVIIPGGEEDKPTTPVPPPPPTDTVTVELSAKPDDGYKFICWSLDRPITEGAEVFATEAAGRFEIPKDSTAVANYVEVGFDVILYRTNGGEVSESGADFYYQTVSNKNYYLPNTLHQNGTFKRDGHILLRYTEKPDGSGKYTTLGGNIEPTANGFCELYLLWAPVTASGFSFSLLENEGGETYAQIDSYSGKATDIVIPDNVLIKKGDEAAEIKVEKIKSGAFENSAITSLVLPSTLREVEADAFKGCTFLKEITLHDNFYEIKDEAFSNCSIPKIYLNAARLPAHIKTSLGMNAYKYDRLRLAAANREKKIIVFAGSSARYGFLAEEMQKSFDGEYRVINFGNNSQIPPALYMEAFLSYFGEDDIIIHAPETTSKTQMGDFTVNYLTFMGSEGMLEIFSYVDMTNYPGFFSALSVFNQEKRNTSSGVSYDQIGKDINEYTDLASNKDNPNFQSDLSELYPYNSAMITTARANALNSIYRKVRDTGAKMYLSWAPINADSCREEAKSAEFHEKFLKKVSEYLDVTVISDPMDYLLENRYFNDSNYHPGPTGAKIRTDRLTADIKAQLEKESE